MVDTPNPEIMHVDEAARLARLIPVRERQTLLMSFAETELHDYLQKLFEQMEPDYTIEITHGATELGKDLVIVQEDRITFDVIAVIVKTGDIRAKTMGAVDKIIARANHSLITKKKARLAEIQSQISQALANPAEMKTIFEALPVNKVFVVLAGKISKQARTRLINELKQINHRVFDIDWLVDKFTSFYPQIFFQGKAFDFLQDRIYYLESKNQFFNKDMHLSDYYVEPRIAPLEASSGIDHEKVALIISRKKLPFSKLRSILDTNKKVILVGDPGTGKTGALSKLAIDLSCQACNELIKRRVNRNPIKVPVLVDAADVLKANDFEDLLANYFGPSLNADCKVISLMVDALDEVDFDQRKQVLEKAKHFSEKLNCGLIIASRKIDIVNSAQDGFERYELMPFEFSQALSLCENIAQDSQTLSALRQGLENIKHDLFMVPLSLILLIQLVEDHREIPASVTELYDRYFDIALGRYDQEQGIEILFQYRIKKVFLSSLAFHEFFEKHRLEIPIDDLKYFINNHIVEYGFSRDKLNEFIHEIERAGILRIEEKVTFCHRSFLDYFAALYIFDRREELGDINSRIASLYFDPIWGDVAFYYVGLKREINDKLLGEIFKTRKHGLNGSIAKLLVGRLLQAGWLSTKRTKHDAIRHAINYVPRISSSFLKLSETNKDSLEPVAQSTHQ